MKNSVANRLTQLAQKEGLLAIVAGSKNDPVFPILNPDIFVGAHGGIFHAKRFPDTTLKCGIITNWLLCRRADYCEIVRSLIEDVNLDILIIIESIPRKYEDIHPSLLVKVDQASILRLSLLQCTLLELKSLGFRYFLSLASAMSPRKLFGFVVQLINEKTSYLTRLSTGMFSALYFYHLLPARSKLYISGIGLQLAGSYFFDKSNQMQKAGHFAQDLCIANKLIDCNSPNNVIVQFTDPEALKSLSEMQHVPFNHYLMQYLGSIRP